jgi:hypothetical protein
MANNLMEVLATVPPTLAAGWAIWFVAGGMLVMWYRRASLEPEPVAVAAPAPKAVSRPKPASRQPSGMSREVAPVFVPPPVEEPPMASGYDPPPALVPAATREKKPVVIGDPFGDLATLLDQAAASSSAPAAKPAAPAPNRAPGDSPILSSSGFPVRRANDEP